MQYQESCDPTEGSPERTKLFVFLRPHYTLVNKAHNAVEVADRKMKENNFVNSVVGVAQGAVYRPEIDGLRAIAVLAVLYHHLTPQALPGGFVGVDIFFVISGYLITAQIDRDAARGKFSILGFYKRRISRILPALLIVLAATTVACLAILSPNDLVLYAKSATSAVFGTSNIFFWRNYAGYFAARTTEAPMLHTWSLGVEEQFYLIWPLVIVLSGKMGRRNRMILLGALTVIAIVVSQLGASNFPEPAYFLLPTRFFELMIGGLLALGKEGRQTAKNAAFDAVQLLGIALILICIVRLSRSSPFPGLNALWPCLGAALVIWAGDRSHLASRLLTVRPMVFVGLISYSLYLWHWPMICLLGYFGLKIGALEVCAVTVASVVLSWVSWKFVETPMRRSSRKMSFGRVFIRRFAIPGVAVSAFALLVILTKGLPRRFSPEVAQLDAMSLARPDMMRQDCHVGSLEYATPVNDACRLGATKAQGDGLLIGDSYANHFTGMIDTLAKAENLAFIDYTMDRCPPPLNYKGGGDMYSKLCMKRNRHAYEEILARGFKRVILAAHWPNDAQAAQSLAASLTFLSQAGVKVTIIEANSPIENAANCPVRKLMFGWKKDCSGARKAPPDYIAKIRLWFPQVNLIDPNKLLCNANGMCSPVLNGKLLYRDDWHLNDIGSREIGRELLADNVTL